MLTDDLQIHRDLLAERAIALWGDGFTLSHVADSGNSVFIAERRGLKVILRLTNPAYRSEIECQGELDYLLHLSRCRCRVAVPLPSRNGNLTEIVSEGESTLIASLFRWAPGLLVSPGDRNWNRLFFQEWGRSLGEIHRASKSFTPSDEGARWDWDQEILLRDAMRLIPEEETEVRRRFMSVVETIQSLPTSTDVYGMTHGDFAPQNFRFDPINGITSFDFGNCCRHFYASDVAISFTALRRRSPDEQVTARAEILDGYRQILPFTEEQEATLPLMNALRVHYVYLSRLYKFGSNPTAAEFGILKGLRGWVLDEEVP